jgi:thioredoxin 2
MSDPLITVCPACQKMNRIPAVRLAEKPNCGACGAPLFTGHPVEVDSAAFDRHARGDLRVLVDVWAPWCGPCRMMGPMFERAAATLEPRMRLLKLNLDNAPDIGRRFGIQSVPTLLLMERGKLKAQTAGAMDAGRIIAWAQENAG